MVEKGQNMGVSPFLYGFEIPVTKVYSSKEMDVPDSEGFVMNKAYYIEKSSSTRIYYTPAAKESITGLSDRAKSMFLWVCLSLKPNIPYLTITPDRYMAENGTKSIKTFTRMRNELLRYSFIANTETKGVYWINPAIFFNGSRPNNFPKNIKVVGTFQK